MPGLFIFEIMPKLDEVFGIRTEPVLSYVARSAVDGKFQTAIESTHHIIVYGSSKQGKTSLRQKYIPPSKCVVVRGAPNTTARGIYTSILRQADIKIETVEVKDNTTEAGVKSSVGFKAMIPWLGSAKTEVEGSVSAAQQLSLTTEFISFDFDEAQSISELLIAVGFSKFIVLENFHYLPIDVQRRLAFDLKTFHEVGIRFVILGIWREANQILIHNGDLEDRLVEVPVEPWEPTDFKLLAQRGSRLLNVQISDTDVNAFIDSSYGNVGMFQEFIKTYCASYGIAETVEATWNLSSAEKVRETFSTKLEFQRTQFLKTLQGIAARSRIRSDEEDPLLLPYYLVRVICRLDVAELQQGISKNRIMDLIRSIHHRDDKDTIRIGDVTNLMLKLPTTQRDTHPPLLYYDDNSRRLRFVDTRHFFVLANVDRQDLEDDIPYPRDVID